MWEGASMGLFSYFRKLRRRWAGDPHERSTVPEDLDERETAPDELSDRETTPVDVEEDRETLQFDLGEREAIPADARDSGSLPDRYSHDCNFLD